MKKIYLMMSCDGNDRSTPEKAFSSEAQAKDALAVLQEHKKHEPAIEAYQTTPEWLAAINEWEAKSPFPDICASFYPYFICQVELL